jgi:hypothetical protein
LLGSTLPQRVLLWANKPGMSSALCPYRPLWWRCAGISVWSVIGLCCLRTSPAAGSPPPLFCTCGDSLLITRPLNTFWHTDRRS